MTLKSGEIQAAIQISHPFGTHFESISIEYEGINGQLANLDLINSVSHIASAQLGVPVVVQNVRTRTNEFGERLQTLLKGMVKQGLGIGAGSGTFGRYKVDAITLRADGLTGNYDDVAFGRYRNSRPLSNVADLIGSWNLFVEVSTIFSNISINPFFSISSFHQEENYWVNPDDLYPLVHICLLP